MTTALFSGNWPHYVHQVACCMSLTWLPANLISSSFPLNSQVACCMSLMRLPTTVLSLTSYTVVLNKIAIYLSFACLFNKKRVDCRYSTYLMSSSWIKNSLCQICPSTVTRRNIDRHCNSVRYGQYVYYKSDPFFPMQSSLTFSCCSSCSYLVVAVRVVFWILLLCLFSSSYCGSFVVPSCCSSSCRPYFVEVVVVL